MKQRLRILNSKLTAFETSNTLQRDRLIHVLGSISHKRMALVTAGAGYGKTTLIAQAIAHIRAETVWYCLDESDNDLPTFMRYLVAGIRKHQPGFGMELEEKLSVPSIPEKRREAILLEFLVEIENCITSDMIIVLDDYHAVQDNTTIAVSMDFLLAHTPSTLHWIFAGRTDPALRASRYRAMQEVIDMGEADLAFRMDEIKRLYADLLKIPMTESAIRKLLQKTGGWAAGLILYFNALQSNPSAAEDERLFELGRSRKFIFQYLEENVFMGQPDEIREFMLKSSLLSRLDPEFCDRLMDRRDSRQILNMLCDNHLFTFPYGDEGHCCKYHHLLQDFLRDRLERSVGGKEVRKLHHTIGNLMEQAGDVPGAMRHYLKGEHSEDLSRVMRNMMVSDFLDCPLPFLTGVLEHMPAELVANDARLLHIWAKLTSLKGDIKAAIRGFQTALERFREEGDSMGSASCTKDLGLHYYLTGNVLRAKEEMEQLWGKTSGDPFFPREVAGYLILFSAILGKMEEADSYYALLKSSLTGFSKAERELSLAWLGLCYTNRLQNSGDFDTAQELNVRNLDTFTRMGMEVFLPLANFQAALSSFYISSPEQGYRYAVEGLSVAAKAGIYDHQYAWLSYAKALNSLGKGEPASGMLIAGEALDIFESHENYWGQACVLELCSMICRKTGRLPEAEAFIKKGLSIIDKLGLIVTQGALAIRLAEILRDKKDLAGAQSVLDEYGKEIEVSKFHRFSRNLLQSRIYTELGETEKGLPAVQSGLELARANNYDPWVLRESSWMAPLLVQCHARGIMSEYIEKVVAQADRETRTALLLLRKGKDNRMRRAADGLIAILPQGVCAPLEIHCLGEFKVFIQGSPIPPGRWRSTAGAKLFKYMALKGDHGFVPMDILVEIAWPGEDPERANRRFHVALSSLRKVLEPDLERGLPSSYILRQRDAYRVEIGEAGTVDFRQFLEQLKLAEGMVREDENEALARYLKAESLYGGPLFEEDPYEDWFTVEQDMLHGKYLSVLQKIMDLHERKGAWKECIEYAEKYLSMDQYAEQVYCALMRFYSHLRRTSRVIDTFKRCEALIQEDLGCPLSDNTIALYRTLIGKKAR